MNSTKTDLLIRLFNSEIIYHSTNRETTYKFGVILPLVMPFLEPVMDYTIFEEVLIWFLRSVNMVSKCDIIYK